MALLPNVRTRIFGHTDSATRERIYQDPQNERVRGAGGALHL